MLGFKGIWVKLILVLFAAIITGSIAYYFTIFLPDKQSKEFEVQKQAQILEQQRIDAEQTEKQNARSDAAQKIIDDRNLQLELKFRDECVAAEKSNSASFLHLMNSCTTDTCRDNVQAEFSGHMLGNAFVNTCTKNKLDSYNNTLTQ